MRIEPCRDCNSLCCTHPKLRAEFTDMAEMVTESCNQRNQANAELRDARRATKDARAQLAAALAALRVAKEALDGVHCQQDNDCSDECADLEREVKHKALAAIDAVLAETKP